MPIPYVKQGAPFIDDPTDADATFAAAEANAMDTGIYEAHLQPCVRVTHSVSQAIVTATNTAVAFDTERFDQAGGVADTMHDTSTNNSRLTCRYAGVYQISGSVEFATSGTGIRDLFLRIGGSTIIAYSRLSTLGAVNQLMTISTLYAMAVNDYVELVVQHTHGSNLNVVKTTAYSPEFMMVRVG